MIQLPEFKKFDSIARLYRECVITEKIDGTNAIVYVGEDGQVIAGSRSQWLVGSDNFGFAKWVAENEDDLRTLGPGYHYGEWWGAGIQRRYGLDHKRFSLFNVSRWGETRPACCHVVPVLYRGGFGGTEVSTTLTMLHYEGSRAAPGFMKPEGIVVWHEHARTLFKITLDGDGHKGAKAPRSSNIAPKEPK